MTFQNSEAMDDMVLIKQDGMPTYNFANVIDDHLMGITHVMRGMEYLSSTPRYNFLYRALGWEIPEYIHLPTVMRDATHKLSKRDGDAYYSDYMEKGFLTEALINYLALVGWNPGTDQEFFTREELIEAFDVNRINKSPGIFDVNKLEWMNAHYVAQMDPEAYLEKATPWFDKVLAGKNMDYRRLAELMQSRTDIFSRIPEKIAFLAEMPEYDTAIFFNKKQKSDEATAKEVLPLLLPVLEGIGDWTEQNLHDAVMEKIQAWERKTGSVLWPMRISISGQESTPGGAFEIAYLLGKDETLRRMRASLARL
jgi:glutamyl-tRNA synthetase